MLKSAISFLLEASPWSQVIIRRGSSSDVQIPVPLETARDDLLVWQFALEELDVVFQLFENGQPIVDATRFVCPPSPPPAASALASSLAIASPSALLQEPAHANIASQKLCASTPDVTHPWTEGQVDRIRGSSVYTLRWDNTYSMLRNKCVWYRATVTSRQAFSAAVMASKEFAKRQQLQNRPLQRENLSQRDFDALLQFVSSSGSSSSSSPGGKQELEVQEADKTMERLMVNLERAVNDVVAIFVTQPDTPLHEGSIRPLVVALETILRHGIKVAYYSEWPEEPYYRFLLETETVLRDDNGLVLQAYAIEPPPLLRYLGWTRARIFLCLALNKNILHRALENLVKRRVLVDKYYTSGALVASYGHATRIVALLSALHGVKCDLAAKIDESLLLDDQEVHRFPLTLKQCCPQATFGGDSGLTLTVGGDACCYEVGEEDISLLSQVHQCTLPRLILNSYTLQEVSISRGSTEEMALNGDDNSRVVVLQIKVQALDIRFGVCLGSTQNDVFLHRPLLSSCWAELVIRLDQPVSSIKLVFDNSFSRIRSKTVQFRGRLLPMDEYSKCWLHCHEMAQLMCWKHVTRRASARSVQLLQSLREEEAQEEAIRKKTQTRLRSTSSPLEWDTYSTMGRALVSDPVGSMEYLVQTIARSDPSKSKECALCLEPFAFFSLSREYKCSACGAVICAGCSRHSVYLVAQKAKSKVCDRCFVKYKDKERERRAKDHGEGQDGGECDAFAALRNDLRLEKYFKMLAVGVPFSAVAQKMRQDEIDLETVHVFEAGPSGKQQESQPTHASACSNATRTQRSASTYRRGHSFRKVHWTSLESSKLEDSIWARVTAKRKKAPITLSARDYRDLEELFGYTTAPTRARGASSQNKNPRHAFTALDSRRANNISIALSQFKKHEGGIQKLLAALADGDLPWLTVETLSSLEEIAPTIAEEKRYANFRGIKSRLEAPEKFLVDMCGIPRVKERIQAILFVKQFASQHRALTVRMELLTNACQEICQSERLARCFELVLAIGNLLNTSGTQQEEAAGVTMSSLMKISETKSIDKSVSLLQFVVKWIHERGEDDSLLFVNELTGITQAKRFSTWNCNSEVKALRRGLAQVQNELELEISNDKERFDEHMQRRQEQQAQLDALDVNSRKDSSARQPRNAALEKMLLQRAQSMQQPQFAARGTTSSSADKKSDHSDPTPVNTRQALLAAIRMTRQVPAAEKQANQTTQPGAKPDDSDPAAAAADPRRALLAAIRTTKLKEQQEDETSLPRSKPVVPDRAAMFAAIRTARPQKQASTPIVTAAQATLKGNDTQPMVYEENSFIKNMRKELVLIKQAMEALEEELDVMNAQWEQTALYLGEDPATCSSDHLMNLLHRFTMEVKVAKSLWARKGLLFTSDSRALARIASVGSSVATIFGSGVVTALRIRDKTLEVKFPSSAEAFLYPNALLRPGDLVQCKHFGIGILRKTMYAQGSCEVRFAFGVGILQVEEIRVARGCNDPQSWYDRILRDGGGFRVGDPVISPFGVGTVRTLIASPAPKTENKSRTTNRIVVVDLVLKQEESTLPHCQSDGSHHPIEASGSATNQQQHPGLLAFVQAKDLRFNFVHRRKCAYM